MNYSVLHPLKDIAERLEVAEEEVLEAMEMSRSYQALSMDHSIESDSDGSTVTLFDILGREDDGYEMTNKRMIVSEAPVVLNEREKQIIQLTYLEQLSQKEAGERLGFSNACIEDTKESNKEITRGYSSKWRCFALIFHGCLMKNTFK